MYIDTHAHILPSFYDDTESIIKRSREAGIKKIINIGTNLTESEACLNIASKHKGFIYPAIGLHPEIADKKEVKELKIEIEELGIMVDLNKKILVAIGEIGLDYHYTPDRKVEQAFLLEEQLKIADKYKLPIIIHCREAFQDLIPILLNISPKWKGVIHSFDGSQKEAETLISLGFHLSFNGIMTFKNAEKIAILASSLPLEKILLETDSPFLTPSPFRGKKNSPEYIPNIYKFLSQRRDITLSNLECIIENNVLETFDV